MNIRIVQPALPTHGNVPEADRLVDLPNSRRTYERGVSHIPGGMLFQHARDGMEDNCEGFGRNREFPAKLKQLRALPPDRLTKVIDFFGMFQWPGASYLVSANNHSIHHRGQPVAYLRAMGSKVPSIYGGSADEPMNAAAS